MTSGNTNRYTTKDVVEILISALLVDIDTHVQEDFHVGDSILVGTKPLLDIELHESQTVAESAKIQ